MDCGDEWDTLPYLIRSTEGHGSFFSMVDIPLTQRHVEWAADDLREQAEGMQRFFVTMGTGHKPKKRSS
jgi:hypothetical protein